LILIFLFVPLFLFILILLFVLLLLFVTLFLAGPSRRALHKEQEW